MTDANLQFIKEEIAFHMEKVFQFSFAYVGALIAAIAGVKLDIYLNVSEFLNTTPSIILAAIIMFLDLVYLILGCSSMFSVLKRGLFIVAQKSIPQNKFYIEWEKFNRKKNKNYSNIAWNIDNYFIIFIFSICFLVSLILFYYSFPLTGGLIRVIILTTMIIHAIPLLSIFQIYRIDKEIKSY